MRSSANYVSSYRPLIVEAAHLTYQSLTLNEARNKDFYQQLENIDAKHIRNGLPVNFVRMLDRILEVDADFLLLPAMEINGGRSRCELMRVLLLLVQEIPVTTRVRVKDSISFPS